MYLLILLTNMNEPLISSLIAIGLSEKEARVFVALIGMGKEPPAPLPEKPGSSGRSHILICAR